MACVPLPKVEAPTLPSPLTIHPSVPELSFDPALCCKVLPFPLATPPIPLPAGVLNPAVFVIINQAMSKVTTYLNSFEIPCPKE